MARIAAREGAARRASRDDIFDGVDQMISGSFRRAGHASSAIPDSVTSQPLRRTFIAFGGLVIQAECSSVVPIAMNLSAGLS